MDRRQIAVCRACGQDGEGAERERAQECILQCAGPSSWISRGRGLVAAVGEVGLVSDGPAGGELRGVRSFPSGV